MLLAAAELILVEELFFFYCFDLKALLKKSEKVSIKWEKDFVTLVVRSLTRIWGPLLVLKLISVMQVRRSRELEIFLKE